MNEPSPEAKGRDTADVEKIARELWAECSNETELKTILDYFAQARAPLVAALEEISTWAEDAMTSTLVCDKRVEAAFQQIKDRAAIKVREVLTGTGEK